MNLHEKAVDLSVKLAMYIYQNPRLNKNGSSDLTYPFFKADDVAFIAEWLEGFKEEILSMKSK